MHGLLLNSGGPEALWCARDRTVAGDTLQSLFISISNPPDTESKAAAEAIAQQYCQSHHNILVEGMLPRIAPNRPAYTSTPYQTIVLLTLTASIAVSLNISQIVSGLHFSELGYPIEDFQAIMDESYMTTWNLTWHFPLLTVSGSNLVRDVKKHALFPMTHSCINTPICAASKTHEEYCLPCRRRDMFGAY